MADYVVVRAHSDLPEGFLPPELEGRWFDLEDIPKSLVPQDSGAVAVPVSRFEQRDDGVVAQVYEVRP